MLTTYMFVAFLLLPGMPAQIDTREPMDSLEACQARVAEVLEAVKEHEGEQYKFLVGCELTGKKADPA
jgi:hypothetical protein